MRIDLPGLGIGRTGGVSAPFNAAAVTSASTALWLDPSYSGNTIVSSAFSAMADRSGNGRNFTQGTPGSRPATSTIAGRLAASFDGVAQYLSGPSLSALTAAEIFVILQSTAATNGLWRMNSDATAMSVYPTGGLLYDGAGSTTRRMENQAPGTDITVPHLYNVTSIAGEWTGRINGTQIFTTGANTVGFDAAGTLLGVSATAFASPSLFFAGKYGALVVFNAKLSAGDRAYVTSALKKDWGIA